MSNLNKLHFTTLEVSGRNYLKWVQDMKLHLTVKNLHPTIEDETDNHIGEAEKAMAMIFIRRHVHDALQTEYLAEEDPRALWSFWLIALITKMTSSCLKQDMTDSIYACKTLSL
ncbi:hypothetical protein D8674_025893 [Pyrus ussuriensis x Pyrus communis]|uniref:Retrotransposon Copia-like N-terminal domain-containing protein n=1 Tax=Pyrus ussuriensis x Pyrus communis TaxID=2448454 RepID=A0A5N5I6I5_9ROSA|nr:hypothetical protein D8674_025893 [Pyrus ussuriensis x Pyrus communis]